MPKVSVVVPIYNVERYLRECIDSIINQTLEDIEIILVDDGSSDGCPAICDEYAAKDSRVKVIHKGNGGYGTACNRGIAEATGEYIGLVESDDWIEPDMYEKLYNQIVRFDAEVCISSFYEYKSESTFPDGSHNKNYIETIENIDSTKLFSILDYPFLYTVHPSVWSKLYKSNFIKNIKFDETPKTSFQDGPFITEVFCRTKKIIGLKDYLYHYRVDNEMASSVNTRRDEKLIKILDSWEIAKNILKKYDMFESLKEEFFFQASKSGLRFYRNIDKKYKYKFFKRWKEFVKEIKGDESFTFKYFNYARKHFIKSVLNDKFRESLFDEYDAFHAFGIPIIEKTSRNGVKKHKVLGITIAKKINKKLSTTKKILFGLIKIKKDEKNKKYYILGVQVKNKKITTPPTQPPFEQYFENQQISILANSSHAYLKQYHNLYNNAEIFIIACGPTINYFKPLNSKIYIGINRAFMRSDINYDYLFAQDQFPEGMFDFDNYSNEKCKKFYGILSNWHGRRFSHCKRIPHYCMDKSNANVYYLESIVSHNWPYDISKEPFGEFKSTVFSALQFALYTKPKRIYLVGCDCDFSGYFYGNDGTHKYPHLIEQWIKAKKHINEVYPDVEIISVNPVGLKSMFKDVYTEEYLKEHPEITNVEVLKTEEGLVNV
ncbi:glycosyltransferase [bacterium]|nr:glycosyltransferase [bacterium]